MLFFFFLSIIYGCKFLIKFKIHDSNFQFDTKEISVNIQRPLFQHLLGMKVQTFVRVQERFSEMVTPKIRVSLEYFFFFIAIILFCVLVVMHANYVQQPGCSSEFSSVEMSKAQLIQIKITSAGLWSHNESVYEFTDVPESQIEMDVNGLPVLAADSWLSWITSEVRRGKSLLKFWKTENDVMDSQREVSITGESFNSPSDDVMIVHDVNISVQWLEMRSKAFEPAYLYSMEKGYFLLPEEARSRHNIRTINISISARHSCFGNRWQQLLINRLVGYDTILMNSLLNSPGHGYLYNYQTKEYYNLTYAHEQPQSAAKFGDYLVTKCGVLMMSFFVFFTTTMSVSFTLRETQTRMLKFTVQLHHHARHRLPTFQLIFVHVIESLVFVPIMIGTLFFLFEFYDDQLLAFMCPDTNINEILSTLLSSLLSSFSYLALSTSAAFMQHLILYFWNRFEVPALQRFMQNRRSDFQQHPDFHITSSTILASTLRITRLNTRNSGPEEGAGNENRGADIGRQAVNVNPEAMNPFSSLLGAATFSESLNSFLSIFRDLRDQGQFYGEPPPLRENHTTSNNVE
ncbi:hypothetical protein ACJIZ3_004672 [Penstemon smallii]|uniref:Membralin n=1 Tax=Penstemon smallii TaxID=265156 RepID=A0ABD3S2Y9_9LAMI